jgi:predicted nucleic acid-binding protein
MIIDSSPLIELDRGGKKLLLLMQEAMKRDEPIVTSHGVLAQVFRDPARQDRLSRLLSGGDIVVHPIDDGRAVGVALALSNTSDVVDAAVAILALANDEVVLTSDQSDFAEFDGVRVVEF